MHSIGRELQDIKRFDKILIVFLKEGLGYYIKKTNLHIFLPFFHRLKPTRKISKKEEQAIRLRRAFEKLGPTFVKLGQLLSLRPDLVPPEYAHEFSKLQDQVQSFSYKDVKKIVEKDLGKPINKLFKSFNKKPIASASVAQVHRAVLKSGKNVVVKVRRPEIQEIIDADLDILFYLANKLEKHSEHFGKYKPTEIVKEFALWTRREINFQYEAQNAIRLRESLKENKDVIVPLIYPEFCSKRVLTLEFIEGIKIDDLKALEKNNIKKKKVATIYFTSILEQALFHGFFHADPHPANIYVKNNGKLVYFDFGIMGELTQSDRKKVIRFINSIQEKNSEKSFEIALSMARKVNETNIDNFRNEVLPIIFETYSGSITNTSVGQALYKIVTIGAQYDINFDPNHVLIAKAIYQAEGLGLKLDPEFDVGKNLEIFAKKNLQNQFSPENLYKKLKKDFRDNKDLILDLPEQIIQLIKELEKEPQQITTMAQTEIHDLEREIEKVSSQGKRGVLVAVLFISALFLFYIEGRTSVLGVPISNIVFVTAVIMSLYFYRHRKR